MNTTIVIAYVPVLHDGYKQFFKKHGGSESKLYIFGPDVIKMFDHLRKEIRALDPDDVESAVKSLSLFQSVQQLNIDTLSDIKEKYYDHTIVMPNEDISRSLAKKHLSHCNVAFDDVFLRWDRDYSVKEDDITCDRIVPYSGFHEEVLDVGYEEANKSSDWWRQVGAVAVKNSQIIMYTHNHHLPSDHGPYAFGDPRNNFSKGVRIELSTAIHAEAALISAMAGEDLSLEGADLYVTTFPCPPCAKLVAYSGVERLFFHEGYSMLDAQKTLKQKNVELIYVKK